jgi:mutator protein MutT
MEWSDIYDSNRRLTGKMRMRGEPGKPGEYGLVVCVWVYDGHGNLLLTRRAKEKTFAGTWENSGGAAQAGEDSLTAVQRELREETGICADKEEFEFLSTSRDHYNFYDHYCLKKYVPIQQVRLLPGETDAARWVTFSEMHELIRTKAVCSIIAKQFLQEEEQLMKRQNAQL